MCHTIPYMGRKIHATTLIIITTFTWHYKRICNMLRNSTPWFTSCTHHSLGYKKWHWKYHKWNYFFYSCNIWWKKKHYTTHEWDAKHTLQNYNEKQLHRCENRCILNKSRNQCKHSFSFNAQPYQQFKFNNYTNHREYHRPKYEDHNVVPYHASLLLLWGAHLNIQRTTPLYWSYYL